MIGLHVGDQMPYFIAGCMNVVTIESVRQSKPNNDSLASLLRAPRVGQ